MNELAAQRYTELADLAAEIGLDPVEQRQHRVFEQELEL